MTKTPHKRTAPRQSDGRTIKDEEINTVYRYLQDAVKVEYPDGPLPELDGPTSILPRKKNVTAGGALPHPEDIRAVIERALATLVRDRSKRPELRYLRLALRHHVELRLSLDQSFGYAKTGKGAPLVVDKDRARRIACAVFDQRFLKGQKADVAGYRAGEQFGIKKTQALEAFASHDGYALQFHRRQRILEGRKPLWTKPQERRLIAYYMPGGERTLDELLAEVDAPTSAD